MSTVAQARFRDYGSSVQKALDAVGAAARLPARGLIIIKPNLTNSAPPPVTTDVRMVEAVYRYCRAHSGAEIAVGEGCGSGVTRDTFAANGYVELAAAHKFRLIDFNEEPAVPVRDPKALQVKTFHLPEVVREAFVISVPVLKDHSFTATTIAMKNMFGLAPAPFYCGSWNKSKLHSPSTHRSVVDLCRYKKPDLSVVDASTALAGMHLAGTPRRLGLILAGADPVAVDAVGSRLMGHDPAGIEYLALAEGDLGTMKDTEVLAA